MSDQIPLVGEGDPPIIIQGGGSVSIVVPPNFTEQAARGNGKDFQNGNVNLIGLQIDAGPVIPLTKDSKITITYK